MYTYHRMRFDQAWRQFRIALPVVWFLALMFLPRVMVLILTGAPRVFLILVVVSQAALILWAGVVTLSCGYMLVMYQLAMFFSKPR